MSYQEIFEALLVEMRAQTELLRCIAARLEPTGVDARIESWKRKIELAREQEAYTKHLYDEAERA